MEEGPALVVELTGADEVVDVGLVEVVEEVGVFVAHAE